MDMMRWISIYGSIVDDFGFDPEMDRLASRILSNFVGYPILPEANGNTAYVIGNGPEISEILPSLSPGYHIVADSAITAYAEILGCPDIIVTDLDGDLDAIFRCAAQGTKIVIHAHGDNMDRIVHNSSRMSRKMIGTTQNVPFRNIANFFGFTDGDRSVYIADHMGFKNIVLVSFDFRNVNRSKPGNHAMKAKKLKWAEALISMIALERGTTLTCGDFIDI